MFTDLPLFPQQASSLAPQVDSLFFFVFAVSLFFALVICALIIFFAIKYRRRSELEVPPQIEGDLRLEILWTVVPLGITLVMFFWGAKLFFITFHPRRKSIEVSVVTKQWMWKAQHLEGRAEINELHVPTGRPVKLIMTSQDVIHSFFVPDFRVKMDVIPGRYTTVWFEATSAGEYRLFCSQYCGTQHSGMIGRIVAMESARYQTWLSGEIGAISMASLGEKLFERLGCNTCHLPNGSGRGPSLVGLFGKQVQLQGGRAISADESYIRESILEPNAKLVAGYPAIMPTFKGLVSEDGIMQIIAYIKSLTQPEGTQAKK